MKKSIPTTTLYLDTRRSKKTGCYPLKLRITFDRSRRYYAIPHIDLTVEDYEKVIGKNIPKEKRLKKARKIALEFQKEVEKYIDEVDEFSFHEFNRQFIRKERDEVLPNDVFLYFRKYLEELRKEGRLNTYSSYEYALKSLKEIHTSKKLTFEQVDVQFLHKYESYMLNKDYSISSIGMWLRSLRAIVNMGIADGIAKNYPFGRGKFQIKNPRARKLALTSTELQKLFNYKTDLDNSEHFYFDLWKFSYLCNGMNVKDICNLQWKNVERNKIYYLREKTKRTNLKGKEIVVPISKEIYAIIAKWAGKKRGQDEYLFRILRKDDTQEQKWAKVRQTVKQINKYTRRIAKNLGIEVKISTYTARHSFATQLMRHGAPTEFISQQLGHASVNTTRDYLENFEERQINGWQKKIMDFDL